MRARLGVAGAVLLGAALRFYPIWFALPYAQARPDETTALGHAAKILAGDPNPHFFNWGSLTFYLFAGVMAPVSFVKGPLAPNDYFLIARGGVALAGTATIAILARLARHTADRTTAVLAALFLAVAVLHVRDSHFATVDVLMTMFVVACLALVLESIDAPSPATFALAGFMGGLAMATKYSAAPLALAVLFTRPGARPRLRDVAAFGTAFAAGFAAGCPYAVLDPRQFVGDVRFEQQHLAAGHGVDLGRGWFYHPRVSLPAGLGWTMFAAAIAGTIPLWTKHRRAALPLGVFTLVFFALAGSGRTVFFRYVLPLIPLACLSAAVFVSSFGAWLAARTQLPRAAIVSALAVLVVVPSLVAGIRLDRLLARTDSRVLAAEWLVPRLTPDDTIFDAGDVIGLALGNVPVHAWRYDAGAASFIDAAGRTPDWLVLYRSPVRHYTRMDPGLEALARARYNLVHEVRGLGPANDSLFDQQDALFVPIAGFDGVERPGPDVLVYRRSDAPPR